MHRVLVPASLTVLAALAACNVPPEAPGITIEPEAPTTVDAFEVLITEESFDQNGDAISYSYAWTVNGQPADLSEAVVPADRTTKQQRWEVTVTPTDGAERGPSVTASVVIENSPPVVTASASPEVPASDKDVEITASATDADDDEVTFTYAWTRDGTATSESGPVLPAAATERGQRWEVTVTPDDGDETGEPAVVAVDIANVAPVATLVELTPATPGAGDTLELTARGTDVDGDDLSFSWAWELNGTRLTADEATLAGAFAKGDSVQGFATPNDGFVDGDELGSEIVVIGNTPPSLTGATIEPDPLFASSTPTCVTAGFADVDADPDQTTYEWLVDGSVAGTTATLSAPVARGQRVQCVATPYDGEDAGEPVRSAESTVQNSAPVLASATLTPTAPREGDTISITLGEVTDADSEDDTFTFAYSWTVNGTVVSTASTLDSIQFDKGDTIGCTVTPSDGIDMGAPVTAATVTAVNSPPVITTSSLSSTTPRTNDTLSASVVTSDADGDTVTVRYAWTVDGTSISPTTASIAGADWFDKDEVVRVTITPGDGDDDGTPSTLSATVQNTPPTAPSISIDPSSAAPDESLTCEIDGASTDADGDTVSYSFAWTRNGTAFTGAGTTTLTGDTIAARDTSSGETWVCTVTPSDGDDDGPTASATSRVAGLGATRASAVKDCKTLKSLDSSKPDGTYWIDPDGDTDHSDAFQAYCDQTTDGGGWTLAWYVDAGHFDGWEGNNLASNTTAPTRINAQKDVWNAERSMTFSETLYGCTTQGDAATYWWRYGSRNPHTFMASTSRDYAYQNTTASSASNTTRGTCMSTHKGGSGKTYGFMVIENGSCGSCNTMLWGMYHYSGGSGCNSTSRTYGSHTSPWRSVSLQYPICGGSQTSNGKFWIGVR